MSSSANFITFALGVLFGSILYLIWKLKDIEEKLNELIILAKKKEDSK